MKRLKFQFIRDEMTRTDNLIRVQDYYGPSLRHAFALVSMIVGLFWLVIGPNWWGMVGITLSFASWCIASKLSQNEQNQAAQRREASRAELSSILRDYHYAGGKYLLLLTWIGR
jgi:hypothetical protein